MMKDCVRGLLADIVGRSVGREKKKETSMAVGCRRLLFTAHWILQAQQAGLMMMMIHNKVEATTATKRVL